MAGTKDTRDMSSGESSGELPLPTFLIIGAQKSGTRWLRYNLGLHPDVFVVPRELAFFNDGKRFETLGISGYRAEFEGATGESIVGEATPGYLMLSHRPDVVAERIDNTLPDVRLIALLRNPIDRAVSAARHFAHQGRIRPDADLFKRIRDARPRRDKLGLVIGGHYAASLQPYADRFGDRLLVLLHDDVTSDYRGSYEQALRHIGAQTGFVPPDLEKLRFSRSAEVPGEVDAHDALSVEQRRELWVYFRRDVRHLEELLGRDLSHWNPELADPERAVRSGPKSP